MVIKYLEKKSKLESIYKRKRKLFFSKVNFIKKYYYHFIFEIFDIKDNLKMKNS